MTDKSVVRYVIVRASGDTVNMKTKTHDWMAFWAVLDAVRFEHQSAGSVWDRPKALMRNGIIVIDSGITDIAWAYAEMMMKERNAAVRRTRKHFLPDFAEEEVLS